MKAATVVLVDISSSMDTPVAGGQRRIDLLSTILTSVSPSLPDMRLFAFNNFVLSLEIGQKLPEPSGGTDLRMALDFAGTLSPRRVGADTNSVTASSNRFRQRGRSVTRTAFYGSGCCYRHHRDDRPVRSSGR